MIAAEEDIEANNKQAVQAGFDAWRTGTSSVFGLLSPDAKWTIVGKLFDGEGTARDGEPYKTRTRGICKCETGRSLT